MPGAYCSPSSPTITEGFFVRVESRALLGTNELYGSLETSSWAYTTYEASVCLQAGQFLDMGQLADLKWSHKPQYEAVDGANIATARIYDVMGDEAMLTIEIQEFHPEIIDVALGSGAYYDLVTEALFTFGDGCALKPRPICIQSTNQSCNKPDSEDIANGITGACLTLYDALCTSGIEWGMLAGEINTIPLEFTLRPVMARAAGNRIGCLNLY
jgi:hypothetical protein